MRRLTLLLLFLPVFASAQRVWEKPIAPGLIYRQEFDLVTPRIVHAFRLSLQNPLVTAKPELFGKTVYEEGSLTGRGSIGDLVEQTGAIAGINGDFFSMAKAPSGNPLGLMVRQGELVTLPGARSVMAWGPKLAKLSSAKFTGRVQAEGGIDLPITILNQKCPKDSLTLNTSTAGFAIADGESTMVTLKISSGTWSPSTVVKAEVEGFLRTETTMAVRPGYAVIVATGAKQAALKSLAIGQTVAITLKTEGFDWEQIDNAIGGGPSIVQNGTINVRAEEEGFPAAFYAKRHPRTAIGRTSEGDLWFVAIDGRQKISDGATLNELAKLMLRLGCVDALNLDGGGSTTINVGGLTLNRPSDGRERPVANGVLFFGPMNAPSPTPKLDPKKFQITMPSGYFVEASDLPLTLMYEKTGVNNVEVFWSSTGAGWVDQGGTFHPLGEGKCLIQAWSGGVLTTREVVIRPKSASATKKPPTPKVKGKSAAKKPSAGKSAKSKGPEVKLSRPKIKTGKDPAKRTSAPKRRPSPRPPTDRE